MGLLKKEIERIREELESCKRPIFFFHDDADGLCSFLLLYRHIREGKGIVVKSKPLLDEKFVKKVQEYEADKVFVLDVAIVKQEFIGAVKRPVIWIDHHSPRELENLLYFNPRKHRQDIIYPVTNICYDVVEKDLWIAMVGCIGDWFIPGFAGEFSQTYPELFDNEIKEPGEALFRTEVGRLATIFNFILKGATKDALKCIKILTRIDSPYEILKQESSKGKYIYHRYEKINKAYDELLEDAKKAKKDRFLIYTYPDNKMSFTGELANELLFLNPDKIIIVAREKNGEMRMSLRSKGVVLPGLIEKALQGLEGYGGGHEYASGANVKKEDFKEFISRLRKEIE